ncbi:MAG TPA: branched-chain amino acid ABC transporter permease [Anaerolineae bacterium]|nr:branched-chain amino acid ABC transporter permease [Anaerolineae bacterium]
MASIRTAGDFDRNYEKDMRVLRKPQHVVLAVVAIAIAFILPRLDAGYIAPTMNRIAYTIIALQGLNILTGYAGQISMGQAAFMLVGGYSSTLMMTDWGLPIYLTIPLAGLTTGLVGMIFGLPSLRVKGFYLAMATLAAQFIIPWFSRNVWKEKLGGTNGFIATPVPELFGIDFSAEANYFFIAFTTLLITTLLTNNISRTKLGRAFVSLRDNDLAAELLGVNLFGYKLRAFFLAAALGGVAGALKAHFDRGVGVEFGYNLNVSVIFLGMLVIGGLGTRLGPWFGAVAIILLQDAATKLGGVLAGVFPNQAAQLGTSFRPIFFGAVLVLFLIFEPRGMAYRWNLIVVSWRMRPFAR